MASRGNAQAWAQDRASVVLGSIVTAVSLGYCIELANGYWAPEVLKLLLAAAIAPVLGMLTPKQSPLQRLCAHAIGPMLLAAVILQVSMLTVFRPLSYGHPANPLVVWALHGCLLTVAMTGFCGASSNIPWRWRVLALALGTCGMGAWVLKVSPAPVMDVFVFAQEGGRALFRGENPFALSFPNVYPDGANYHPDLLAAGRVQHGFPYPPVNLVVGLGDALTGDPRSTLVAALAAAAVLLACIRPSARALQATALLVLTPRCLFLLEQSFMEPLAILFMAATAWTSRHKPRFVPVFLGLLLVSKQTMPGLFVAAWLLPQCRGPWPEVRALILRTLGVGAAINLPFLLINPARFWHSLVTTHLLQLKPPVSITLASYLLLGWQIPHVPVAWSVLLLGVCSAALWAFAPRTPSGFCFGMGLNYLAFLLVNAQGFANYHHFIIACMLACVACADLTPPPKTTPEVRPQVHSRRTPRRL